MPLSPSRQLISFNTVHADENYIIHFNQLIPIGLSLRFQHCKSQSVAKNFAATIRTLFIECKLTVKELSLKNLTEHEGSVCKHSYTVFGRETHKLRVFSLGQKEMNKKKNGTLLCC